MNRLDKNKTCKKCVLNDGDPNLKIDDNGYCNICNQELIRSSESTSQQVYVGSEINLKKCYDRSIEFDEYIKRNEKRDYDCMLMLSGGKDSLYILNKIINKDKLNPLMFTFNHPFESKKALKNIETVMEKIPGEYVNYSPSIISFKEIMKTVLTKKYEDSIVAEVGLRIPCAVCALYMILCAILFAKKMNIRYVFYCADSNQMTYLPTSTKFVLHAFINLCGENLFSILPQKAQIEELINLEEDELPQIVYPFATIGYDANEILKEVKNLGLYESSPTETHCILYPLLNLYSIKRYNKYYYSEEISSKIRSGLLERDKVIKFLNQYKELIVDVAKKDQVNDEDKKIIRKVIAMLDDNASAVEYESVNIERIPEIMKYLGVNYKDV